MGINTTKKEKLTHYNHFDEKINIWNLNGRFIAQSYAKKYQSNNCFYALFTCKVIRITL